MIYFFLWQFRLPNSVQTYVRTIKIVRVSLQKAGARLWFYRAKLLNIV